MYYVYEIQDTIRFPPNFLGGNLKRTILKLVQEEYEGLLDEDLGVVISVVDVEDVGEGKVVPGDGAVYYDVTIKMVLYKPEVQELVTGVVSEITEFGAFVRTGPIEGLIHVSQIMDDYINYDPKLPGFTGKESNKKLQLNDNVLARIVTVSLKDSISSSKIGLTMRQVGLGKEEWRKIDEKIEAKKETKKGKKEKKK